MTDREALAAELVGNCAVARERRYALLASATTLHASLSYDFNDGHDRSLTSFDDIPACVDRAESLLVEIEKREREANNKGDE